MSDIDPKALETMTTSPGLVAVYTPYEGDREAFV